MKDVLSPCLRQNEFKNEMTLYDLDRLHIKLTENCLNKIMQKDLMHENLWQLRENLLSEAGKLNTAKSIEDFDKMLSNYKSPFFNYRNRFDYFPSALWSKLALKLQEKYCQFKKYEDKYLQFYHKPVPDTLRGQLTHKSPQNSSMYRVIKYLAPVLFFGVIGSKVYRSYYSQSHNTNEVSTPEN